MNRKTQEIIKQRLATMKYYGIDDIRIKGLLRAFASHPTEHNLMLIDQLLDPKVDYSNFFFSSFAKPLANEINGLLKIGFTEHNNPIGFGPEDKHVAIFGRTGCGKSTLLRLPFAQIFSSKLWHGSQQPIGWIISKAFDVTDLLSINNDILVITFDGSIKFNMFEPPPRVPFEYFAPQVIDAFMQAFRLFDGSRNFWLENINLLYRKLKKTGHYPSLIDFYYYIKSLKFPYTSRIAHFQESGLNRIGGVISGNLGKVFDCSRGHIQDIFNRHCIFVLAHLPLDVQVFFINYLLIWLYNHKSYMNFNPSTQEHYVGIDDSMLIHDIAFEKRIDSGMPILHQLIATIRKAGITIISTAQSPASLGSSIFSNSGLTITMQLSDGQDIERMIRMMGIKDSAQREFCYKIPQRQAIVKMGRYPEPFVLIIPDLSGAKHGLT